MSKSLPPLSTTTGTPPAKSRKLHWTLSAKRQVATLSRWLHVYLSMASFAILLFFAATGLTLNHADWFAKQQTTTQLEGAVDIAWAQPGREPDKLNLVEYFRTAKGIQGAVSDFRVDESECDISFKGPGYAADAIIDRSSGRYRLTITRMGLIAILNDLHKGRDTGQAWSRMIDVSAVLMCLVSLTGLLLILFLYKRRFSGLVVLGAGAVICVLIYRTWVP
jgi:hypothetical protein